MQYKILSRFLLLILVTGVAVAVNSCKKYLEPSAQSSFSTTYVFSNVQNAQKAVFSVYADLEGDQGYGIRISMYYPYDNDEMIGMHQLGDNDRGDIAHYNAQPGNAQLYAPWTQLYQGIERANICIYNLPQMSLYTQGNTQQVGELQRLYGEALTLRAQFYFELIRNWGDVPAQYLPSSEETNLFLAKTDRDSIYDHLLNDLAIAENLVPWRTEVTALGDALDQRITQGAVRALRARIALNRGGYSLRRASSIYGQTMARPADYLNYYKIALAECQAVMARPDQHTLNPSFQAVFKNAMDAHTIEPNGEVIFEVGMTGGQGTNDSKLGYYDGVKVDATLTGNAAIGVLPTYFYLFDSTDNRRDVTCGPYELTSNLTTLKGHPITTVAEAKFRRDWISNPSELTSTGEYYGIDWPIIRLPDVLLMFAEADNEINQGPSAEDIAALQQVQIRGHGGNAALIPPTPTDYADFFNAIVKERSLEFGGEGVRKFDLIRWNLLGTRIADTKTNLTNLAARNGTYVGNYTFDTVNFADLPDSEFYNTTGSTIANEVQWGISFYVPRTVSSISGYTEVAWVTSTIANVLSSSGSSNGYAFDFTPDHSELLPIPQAAIDADYNLTQDYGY
jgi:starch-binding outer membrane protein, SusD/RagB family